MGGLNKNAAGCRDDRGSHFHARLSEGKKKKQHQVGRRKNAEGKHRKMETGEKRGERQNKEFIIALQHFQLVNIKYKEKGFSLLYFTFTCLLYVMFASVCSMLNLLAG